MGFLWSGVVVKKACPLAIRGSSLEWDLAGMQGLRCFPFYLARIIFTLVLVLVYGGSYVRLGSTYRAAEERATIFFILSCVLPMLALQALPIYTNHVAVRTPTFTLSDAHAVFRRADVQIVLRGVSMMHSLRLGLGVYVVCGGGLSACLLLVVDCLALPIPADMHVTWLG